MLIRGRFAHELDTLRSNILEMSKLVDAELALAMEALQTLDEDKAAAVFELDERVNAARFAIEEECIVLIGTQQPMASDLRNIVTTMNIIVDLERMGDQAKGIAKVIPHMQQYRQVHVPDELGEMAAYGRRMLSEVMMAFEQHNAQLAKSIARQDDEIDALYARVFKNIMTCLAESNDVNQVEATYETLRVARELERFGDLITNICERVIYGMTGAMHETNLDGAMKPAQA
ncbi:MAG: phosphate signaling complex protein PhoU [Caldilineales bacterium]|nr:phosphate signaling complex protein PhoU [Caldilineales bacterium]